MSAVPFDEMMGSFGIDRTVDDSTQPKPQPVEESRKVVAEFKSEAREYRIVEVILPPGPFDYWAVFGKDYTEHLVLETKSKDSMGKECWRLSEDVVVEGTERLDLIAEIVRRSR